MTINPQPKDYELLAEIISYNNRNGYSPTHQYLIKTLKISSRKLRRLLKRFELEDKLIVEHYKTRGIRIK